MCSQLLMLVSDVTRRNCIADSYRNHFTLLHDAHAEYEAFIYCIIIFIACIVIFCIVSKVIIKYDRNQVL